MADNYTTDIRVNQETDIRVNQDWKLKAIMRKREREREIGFGLSF